MNLLKHMEAVFLVTVAAAVSGSWLIDTLPEANARAVSARAQQAIPVVVVSAKRMSAEEKQRSLQAERSASTNAASRI